MDLVDVEAIKAAGFTVAVDCVNSVGGIAIPALLEALGVKSKSYIVTRTDNFHIIPNHCLRILPKFLL